MSVGSSTLIGRTTSFPNDGCDVSVMASVKAGSTEYCHAHRDELNPMAMRLWWIEFLLLLVGIKMLKLEELHGWKIVTVSFC